MSESTFPGTFQDYLQQTTNGNQPNDLQPSPGSQLLRPEPYATCPQVFVLETYETYSQHAEHPLRELSSPAFFIPKAATEAAEVLFSRKYRATLAPNSVMRSWTSAQVDAFSNEEYARGSRRIQGTLQDGKFVMVSVRRILVAGSLATA